MKEKFVNDTGTPIIIINGKIVRVPPKVDRSLNTYLNWLYDAYKENDPNFDLDPEKFIDKLYELMKASWKKAK